MKKIELLAPAGSFEKAKIAFMYGADAVYCGTPKLSLRSRSEVNDDDLEKTIEYAHSIGKKVNVAINIYAWDEEAQVPQIYIRKPSGANRTFPFLPSVLLLPEHMPLSE